MAPTCVRRSSVLRNGAHQQRRHMRGDFTCLMSQPAPSPGGLDGHAKHTAKLFLNARLLDAVLRIP